MGIKIEWKRLVPSSMRHIAFLNRMPHSVVPFLPQQHDVIWNLKYSSCTGPFCRTPSHLPSDIRSVHERILQSAHGPGRMYVLKLFVPWLLPTSVREVVVLDFDLWFLNSFDDLYEQFASFEHRTDAVCALASDVIGTKLYRNMSHPVNGGVQLMRLDRMRHDGHYLRVLNETSMDPSFRAGYLGDQTTLTHLFERRPSLLLPLPCEFNRQLNEHMYVDSKRYTCPTGCSVLHGNQPKWKPLFSYGQDRTKLLRLLPKRLHGALADCIIKVAP